jgi:hypothetical protein
MKPLAQTGLNPWQTLGTTDGGKSNDLIAEARRERELRDDFVRSRSYVPSQHLAHEEGESARADLAACVGAEATKRVDLTEAEAKADAAASAVSGTKLKIRGLEEGRASALQTLADDEALGSPTTRVDIGAVDQELEVERLRLAAREAKAAEAAAPLPALRAELSQRVDRRKAAEARVARAQLMLAAAELVPALVERLAPLKQNAEDAARAGFSTGDAALREIRRAREQILRELLSILPAGLERTLDYVPRPKHSTAAPGDGITMYVKAGCNFGGDPAGTRVVVTEADLRQPAIASTLMSEAEYEAAKSARVERSRPRVLVNEIKNTVERELARLLDLATNKRADVKE